MIPDRAQESRDEPTGHVGFDAADDPAFGFTLDVDIARASAVTLLGPPVAEVFPELPRAATAAIVARARAALRSAAAAK